MQQLHRVVITGVGALTPAGCGVEPLWDALLAKRCCLGRITRFDPTDYAVRIAGEIPDYDNLRNTFFSHKDARRLSRFVQYALIAADEAMRTSELDISKEDPCQFACVFSGGTGGGMEIYEREIIKLYTKGPKAVSPLFIPSMIANMAAAHVSMRYGFKGECTNVITACATGTHATGTAYRLIRHGDATMAMCGGSEETIVPTLIAGFGNLGALMPTDDAQHASMPFDRRRGGFVASEGAGALVLEEYKHACARGAHIYAEIVGFGATGDAYHVTAPDPTGDGAARAMRRAVEESGYSIADISHINAHGTATQLNDTAETAAIYRLCGSNASQIPVFSVKGAIGHMLSGAGAIEAVVSALSLDRGIIPPTTGFAEPDPKCNLNVVTHPLTNNHQVLAISNSMGFGGHNGALAFAPCI
jgi:3-oxoacyl-[acyl-carrier-protein] synthase II